jgi:hypothetical protein
MLSAAGHIIFLLLVGLTVLATPLMAIKNLPFRLLFFLVALIMLFLNFEEARGIAQANSPLDITSTNELALTLSLLTSVVAAIGVMAFVITRWADKYLEYFWYRFLFFVGFGAIAFIPTFFIAKVLLHA